MNFNFGEVLSRAWQITWKYKILWIFGVFAGCSRGGGGGSGGGSSGGGGNGPGIGPGGQLFSGFERFVQEIGQWINDNPWIVAVVIIFILVMIVISLFLGTIGRIALIKGTEKAERGAESMSFGELFSESMPYFWRVLGLSILIGIMVLILIIPFALIGIVTMGICLLPLICILIPASWALAVVIEQANIAIVLEDLSIGDGLRRGWEVVRANVGTMIVMALILFVGSGVVGFIIAIPVIAALFPLVIGAANNNTSPIWFGIVCCAVYFPILLLLNGMITTFMQTAWALTYMRVTKPQSNIPMIIEANA